MNHPIGVKEISHRSDAGQWAGGDEAIGVDIRYQKVSVDYVLPGSRGSAQGLEVSRWNGFGDADKDLVALAKKRDPVEQLKAFATYARARGISLDRGFFRPGHELMVSCGPPAGNRSQIAGAAPLSLSQLIGVELSPLFGVPECGSSAGVG
jgi:hypothetical protein